MDTDHDYKMCLRQKHEADHEDLNVLFIQTCDTACYMYMHAFNDVRVLDTHIRT